MVVNWKKYTASALSAMALFLCPSDRAFGAERVVILAPAAADVFERLDAENLIVGVTNSVTGFPAAVKVGTHLNPGVEKIASLQPSLIIATSRFNPALAERMGAGLFVYEPRTMDEIIDNVRRLSRNIGKEGEGRALADELQSVLDSLVVPGHKPTVLYETRSTPLSVAKGNSIMKDLLERAGMRYAYPESTGALSVEYLMANQPEYYLYQDGPMNRNPMPPPERRGWGGFRACSWKVNEFDFARPNTKLFETVRMLNRAITSDNACLEGFRIFSGTRD